MTNHAPAASAPLALCAFPFEAHAIRACLIDGEPWFVAKDIFAALDISFYGQRSLKQIPEHWRGVGSFATPLSNQHGEYGEQEQEFLIIAEPAVYKIAFRSNKPSAEAFTNRVAEIITTIRKTGRFEIRPVQRLSGAQVGELSRRVDCLSRHFRHNDEARQQVFNALRMAFNVEHVNEIPASHYDAALAWVKAREEAAEEMADWIRALQLKFLKEVLCLSAPWTPTIRRKWLKAFGVMPETPDWLAMQEELRRLGKA